MIKLVVDSTCNLSDDVLKQFDIRVAPISIQFGAESYEEEIDIDRDLFYRKIDEMGIIPTTAQPTPAWYEKYYRELSEQGHKILVITITSKHSGTYDSAVLAKSMVPEAEVEVFDSLNISLGTGFMALEAARAIEAGQELPDILNRLHEIRGRASLFFTPSTLKYLQMSGRVGKLAGVYGSLLDIKPIIGLEEGKLATRERVRTRGKATTRILELTEENVGTSAPIHLGVVHARAEEEGRRLLEQAKARLNIKEVLFADLVASLAVHGGPGILMMIAYQH
ncbi:MAG: DegV family EDD domain-containing protein [Anaerolineales bacterium]|nr:DegV family EDD domain-containing protein [Anaerolineales bacterium]